MNFFESELKKIMRNSAILKDQKYPKLTFGKYPM